MTPLRVSILVPSRGRPGNLSRLSAAVAGTATSDYRIYCRLDDDDPSVYPDLDNVTYIVGPRIRFAASANELAAIADYDGATHFAVLGDDVVPESLGWDVALISALGGRLGVAYGSDGLEHLHGSDLPTHVVVPVELYRLLGWIAMPQLRHLFCDNVWRELGRGLDNLVYVPAVKLTHLHRWAKTAPDDRTYREANDKRKRADDRRAFEVWRDGTGLPYALECLRAA